MTDPPVLTTIRLNAHHPLARIESRDVCRMHTRIIDANAGMPCLGPRILWAQPFRDVLVVRAPEPVGLNRLPRDYARDVTHREWRPPSGGRCRGVAVLNMVRQKHPRLDAVRGKTIRTPIADRVEQADWLRDRLDPFLDDLMVEIVSVRSVVGRREHALVTHQMSRVRLAGTVVDPDGLAARAEAGIGKALAYGGGLTIWETA